MTKFKNIRISKKREEIVSKNVIWLLNILAIGLYIYNMLYVMEYNYKTFLLLAVITVLEYECISFFKKYFLSIPLIIAMFTGCLNLYSLFMSVGNINIILHEIRYLFENIVCTFGSSLLVVFVYKYLMKK